MADREQANYTAKDIQVLEGLEAVRRRPGMYIGSTDQRGLHHLVYEVVDNAVDEAMAGYCDKILIRFLADGGVEVTDDGRGIPVDMHATTGKSALETIMTTLHAGGKFGGGAYKVSGGLHGVGSSVVNALSDFMRVEVRRDGHLYYQEYRKGAPLAAVVDDGPLPEDQKTMTGTKVRFYADADIFTVEMYQWTALKYCGGSLPAHYDSPTMQNIMEEENKKRASDIEKRLQDRSEFFDVIDHKTRNKHLEKQNKELQDEIDEMRALTKPCETNDVLAPASVST